MKKTRLFGCIAAAIMLSGSAVAQNNGGIDSQMLKELSDSYKPPHSSFRPRKASINVSVAARAATPSPL